MSDLLNSASLVMIPSGYAEDKVYSVVPSDGSGDLSFTRASNGTRVNSAGLVEVTPWNLLSYSEGFNASYWNKRSGTTITADTTIAPNGTTTADTATKTSGDGYIWADLTLLPSTTYTISVYAKGSANLYFNAYWGTGSSTGSAITLTSDWQRLQFTFTTGSTTSLGDFGFFISATCYIWGAQLNIGSTANPYFPTIDRLNVPRLTYQNGGGGCPSLLLEKQSTNLVSYSEQFGSWLDAGGTTTANTAISPDGTQNADTLTGARYQIGFGTTSIYTFSCYAKKVDSDNKFVLRFDIPTLKFAQFDLGTGTIDSVSSGFTATITNVGNGWYRCTLTSDSSISISNAVVISANGGSNSTYVWGAQLEASSYPTSYIPTTSSSATRVADVCNKYSISSLIGQTEGTLYGQVAFPNLGAGGGSSYIYITDGSFTNSVIIGREPQSPNSKLFFYINAGGTNILNNTANNLQSGFVKMAIGYKSGSWAAYLNGTLVASGTSTFTFSANMTRFGIGTNDGSITITGDSMIASQAILFPTRLTNAELASLTTI